MMMKTPKPDYVVDRYDEDQADADLTEAVIVELWVLGLAWGLLFLVGAMVYWTTH